MNVQFDPSRAGIGIAGALRPPPGGGRGLADLAQQLGVSTADLETARKNGQSLSDFASSKGISRDDLLAAVKADIKAHKPDGAPELSDDQLSAMASQMIDARRGQRPVAVQPTQMPPASVLDALQQMKTADGTSLADVLASLQVKDQDGSNANGLEELLKVLQSNTYGADGSVGVGTSLGMNAAA
jgi:hypothetical protein